MIPYQEDERVDGTGTGATWDDLIAEVRAFEEWYLPGRMGVNAWVGVDTISGFYGGWSIEGDPLTFDDFDESEMQTAAGSTPEDVIADLIRIARRYRQHIEEQRAEWAAEEAEAAAGSSR